MRRLPPEPLRLRVMAKKDDLDPDDAVREAEALMTPATPPTDEEIAANVSPRSPFIPDPKDQPDWQESEYLERIARRVINEHGERLSAGIQDAEVLYLWKAKGGSLRGRWTLGKAATMTGLTRFLGEADFLIWLAVDHCWSMELTEDQLCALIFHELKHLDVANGGLIPHDLEVFVDEMEIFGPWSEPQRVWTKRFADAMQPYLPGLETVGGVTG